MNAKLQRFLRQYTVRVRIWAAVLLLVAVLAMAVPLLISGQNRGGAQQVVLSELLGETERSLLAAATRIVSSRAAILSYMSDRVVVPDFALEELSEALAALDAASSTAPAGIAVVATSGEALDLSTEVRSLRELLVTYQSLIEQLPAARLGGDEGAVVRLEIEVLSIADDAMATAEWLAESSGIARAESETLIKTNEQRWLVRTLVGYGIGAAVVLGLVYILLRSVTAPLDVLRAGAEQLSAAPVGPAAPTPLPVDGEDDLASIVGTMNTLSGRLARSYQVLDQRVEERTSELTARIGQLRTIIEVARAASELSTMTDTADQVVELDALLQSIVDVVRRRLSLYYVGLFLLDETALDAPSSTGASDIVLRAGTGEAGARMVARGHRLVVGEGMIGWAVANGQARVALEAEMDFVRVRNPDLPDTRSEAAIPLRVIVRSEELASAESDLSTGTRSGAIAADTTARRVVIGALTVQDDEPGAFDEATLDLLQTMADLLGIIIQNARRYRDARTTLAALRQSYGREAQEGWFRVLGGQAGYLSTRAGNLVPTAGPMNAPMRQAVMRQEVVEADGALVVPIAARGQTLGALRLQRAGSAAGDASVGGQWTDREVGLVQTIVEQLGLALDSARLYEDTQISASRERTAREIADRMRATLDWDELMQTAIREIGRAVDASHVYVQWLSPAAGGASPEGTGSNGEDKG